MNKSTVQSLTRNWLVIVALAALVAVVLVAVFSGEDVRTTAELLPPETLSLNGDVEGDRMIFADTLDSARQWNEEAEPAGLVFASGNADVRSVGDAVPVALFAVSGENDVFAIRADGEGEGNVLQDVAFVSIDPAALSISSRDAYEKAGGELLAVSIGGAERITINFSLMSNDAWDAPRYVLVREAVFEDGSRDVGIVSVDAETGDIVPEATQSLSL